MYASVGHKVPHGRAWTFEPKYDGVRVLAHISPRSAKLITRNGNDKAKQFPEIVAALVRLSQAAKQSFIMDGEIVALQKNIPARFQVLQSRMHLKNAAEIVEQVRKTPVALFAFDILKLGNASLLAAPWLERRRVLEGLLRDHRDALGDDAAIVRRYVRLTPSTRGSGKAMVARARRDGWEGIIAKRIDIPYTPGARSDGWLKLKVEFRQEFVVGGFTKPRNTREYIGALLLGQYDDAGRFIYVGHMGGGFTRAGLRDMYELLRPLIRKRSPFVIPPRTNEAATWVKPEIVVEVKFNEWTADGRLRQPIFVGIRDDKNARDVTREATSLQSFPAAKNA